MSDDKLDVPKKWKLTRKQKDFADELLRTGNAVESAVYAYQPKNRNGARVISFNNLRNEKIRAYIQDELVVSNTVGKSTDVLHDALEARVMYQGEETEAPDHSTRLKAVKQVFDLLKEKL
jgi:phage terminase small subunit